MSYCVKTSVDLNVYSVRLDVKLPKACFLKVTRSMMSHYRHAALLWSVIEPIIYIKVFPITVFVCQVVLARICTTLTMWVLLYCRFDPDDNHFSLHLCNVTEL